MTGTAGGAGDVILRADRLTKRFPGVVALREVCFSLRRGEIHALCGENGAGKSTLIKALCGVYPAGSYEGRLLLDEQEAALRSTADAERAGIAVIHQELALVPQMTVAENVFLGREPLRGGLIDWGRVYGETRDLVRRLGIDLDPARRVGDLGIGHQQLTEIVKALGRRSRVLLLDEPTAALTEVEVGVLQGILRGLRAGGLGCLYISHRLGEVFSIADRVTVLRDGQTVGTFAAVETSRGEVIRHMVGREIQDLFPRRAAAPGEVLLAISGLSVGDGAAPRPVLDGIGFDVRGGEVVGLGGLMGAGRTELLLHLFGAFGARRRGEVRLRGAPICPRGPAEAIGLGMALVSEDRRRYGLVPQQSIGFNLSLSSIGRLTRGGLIDRGREVRDNRELMKALRVKAAHQGVDVSALSGGNQQKVVLGRSLMTAPSVVLLDEPTRGIDVGAKLEVYEIVNRLSEAGAAVLLCSSELPELLGMSDRIVMLSAGRLGGIFDARRVTQEELLAAAMRHHDGEP